MIIIAAKNAFLKNRTGIEEYMLQLIKYLANIEKKKKIIIYTNKVEEKIDFPGNFHLKIIKWPFLWTQIGLSLKILKFRVCSVSEVSCCLVLWVPAHVMPLIHPKRTIVTIHGLEYEYFPEYYSWFSRSYLRWSTRYATKHAWKIIAVSKNTKHNLVKLYGCDTRKIEVVYHGVDRTWNRRTPDVISGNLDRRWEQGTWNREQKKTKYFLYLGRIELKKNVLGIINAFSLLKKRAEHTPKENAEITPKNYKLVLAGGAGYGYKKIKNKTLKIKNNVRKDIIFTDHVSDEEKWQLLRNAEALVFPSFYEGFGMPILEAQSIGTPVITSNNSSMKEITSETALLVNPNKPEEIVKAMYKIVSDKELRDELIRRGYKNVKKFSWQECAKKTLKIISNF